MVVVIVKPKCQLATGIGQGEEDLHVQALVAQPAVEALDVAVLHGPSWPDEVQMHTVAVGPQIYRSFLRIPANAH